MRGRDKSRVIRPKRLRASEDGIRERKIIREKKTEVERVGIRVRGIDRVTVRSKERGKRGRDSQR